MNANRFAYERLLMNVAGAFLLPISNALIGNTSLPLAAKMGLGYALAVTVGFTQNPNKPMNMSAQVEVGGQTMNTTAQVRVGGSEATTEPEERKL